MNEVVSALHTLIMILDSKQLRYAVIGGIAVRAHGIPRPTYDIDVAVEVDCDHVAELLDACALQGFEIPEIYRTGWADHVAEMPLIKLKYYVRGHGVDTDVFLAESSFQKSLIERRQLTESPDGVLWVASPEDIVLLKAIAHRARDVSDALDILFAQGRLDHDYMRHWAERCGILPQLEDILRQSKGME